jgi:LysM repeat protein
VDTTINNLSSFAKHLGCNLATIKLFNPWLINNSLNNTAKKSYLIKIPKNLKADYSPYLKDLLGEDGDLSQNIEDKPEAKIVNPDTITLVVKPIIYTVRIDEPIKNIASFYKVKLEDLLRWNNLKDVEMAVKGQTLSIYYNPNSKIGAGAK